MDYSLRHSAGDSAKGLRKPLNVLIFTFRCVRSLWVVVYWHVMITTLRILQFLLLKEDPFAYFGEEILVVFLLLDLLYT